MNSSSYYSVGLTGQGGHTFCNSSFSSSSHRIADGVSAIGGAFAARAEAKQNWRDAAANAIRTGNHYDLPNGKHNINGYLVTVTKNNIIYKNPETRESVGVVKETGQTYTFSGL